MDRYTPFPRRRRGLLSLRAALIEQGRNRIDANLWVALVRIDLLIARIDRSGGQATLGDISEIDRFTYELRNAWNSLPVATKSSVLSAISLCPHGQIEGLCTQCR